jgi:hypothetical protein
MRVTEFAETRLFQQLQARQLASDAERMPGLHLSRIVNDIQQTLYPGEFRNEIKDPNKRMYFEFGNIIEDMVASWLAQRQGWCKPAPRQYRGIWCSPDGHHPGSRTIDEVKACWKSARNFQGSPKWDGYVRQGVGYLKPYNAKRLRLHIVFMNGDWKPPIPWPPRTFLIKPTASEIEDGWDHLEQHAKDREWL